MNAASRYIASVYENCIDRNLDLAQIGQELAKRGIPRTPYQLEHDLEHIYCFPGYAASHQPVPALPVQAFDKVIDRDHSYQSVGSLGYTSESQAN